MQSMCPHGPVQRQRWLRTWLHTWLHTWLCALALVLAALGVTPPLAAATEQPLPVLRLEQAARVFDHGAPSTVRLPDWPMDPPPAGAIQRVRYRIAVPDAAAAAAAGPEGLGLFMQGLLAHGTLSFNGHVLRAGASPGGGTLPRGLERLVFMPLPAALWRAQGNTIELDLLAQKHQSVSALEVGTLAQLTQRHRALTMGLVIAPLMVAAVMGVLGAGMLWLSLRQGDALFALFGTGALAWAAQTAMPLLPWPRFGGTANVVIWESLFTLVVTALAAFCLRLAQWRVQRVEVALAALTVAAPLLLAAAQGLQELEWMSRLLRLVLLGLVALAVVAIGRAAWRWRNRASLALGVSGLVALALGAHDWVQDLDESHNNPQILWTYAALLFAATVVGILIERYVQAARETRQLNQELEARVAAQGQQLRESVAQMRGARDSALAADRAKSSFLAAASHDLRQPAHALGLYLAAMPSEGLRPEQAEVLQRMRESLRALERMFDALLDVSRIDAGAVVPQAQLLAPWELMRRLADEHAAQAERRGLRLALRAGSGAEHAWVSTDPLLLERCLRNLLSNALKYTTSGGVLLACRVRRADRGHGGAVLLLEVWDSGRGIALAEQERVFEEFYQSPSPHGERQRAEGLGLGLAIVRRLAKLLAVGLQLRSVPGRGSVFRLTLPVAPTGSAGLDTAALASHEGLRLSGRCLAFIEDDADVRQAMQLLFRRWGCQLLVGATADEVLQLCAARELAPEAVLVDYNLGAGRTGPGEARRLMAALARQLPVLVITGEQSSERVRELQQLGLPWLAKPVAVDALWLALQPLLSAAPPSQGAPAA